MEKNQRAERVKIKSKFQSMNAPSNLDRRNVLCGNCKAIDCNCELPESAKTSDFCNYCNNPPMKHWSWRYKENTNEKSTNVNIPLIKPSDYG